MFLSCLRGLGAKYNLCTGKDLKELAEANFVSLRGGPIAEQRDNLLNDLALAEVNEIISRRYDARDRREAAPPPQNFECFRILRADARRRSLAFFDGHTEEDEEDEEEDEELEELEEENDQPDLS